MSAPGSPAGPSPKMSGRQVTLPTRPAGPPQSSTHARTPSGASAASGAAPGQARSNFPPPLGYDPGKMDTRAPLSHEERVGKRVDLPADAYLRPDVSSTFATRSGFNTEGTSITLAVNQYPVTRIANMDVFQYDIALSPEPTAGVVYDKVWKSKMVQQKLASVTKKPWIYDGRKLAWLAQSVDEMRLMVDLDAERGRKPGGERKNVFHITIRPTGKVRLQSLKAYLTKTAPWDNHVLECMSFLDHLLRQGPSERMKTIKRSFFHPSMSGKDLDLLLMAYKGVYASFRLSQNVKQIGLGVNVDVSNQTFWKANTADKMMKYVINAYGGLKQNLNDQMVTSALKPLVNRNTGRYEQSEAMRSLRRLKGCRFTLTHRPNETKEYKIKGFAFDKKYGPDGANSYNVTFKWRKPDGTEKEISIRDYMKEKYGYVVRSAGWPVIETTRAGSFPAEVCNIVSFNQYQYKLDPLQTAAMIKFAVQRPDQRKNDIRASVQRLDWANDKYLKAFGVSISPDMAKTEAKVLRHPEVFFDRKTARPLNTGRWDLRGARFVEANREPLTRWAFFGLNNCVDQKTVSNFVNQFMSIYKGHGGRIVNPKPYMTNVAANPATLTDELHKHVGMMCGGKPELYPQIVFIAVPDKSAHLYERLKKVFECRYGIVTQVLHHEHVKKAQGQYISNVCMKVNAKLGGQTSSLTATNLKNKSHGFFLRPTMMIGVDVTHASPGSDMPSIAAMCASVDAGGYQYRAAVQTNGWHNEILTDENIQDWVPEFLKGYRENTKQDVEHIYYFRDGVSEGQFAHVMNQEVAAIRKAFTKTTQKQAKITVIVATKRHHIRFFPDKGDRNGNCEPGTLVEKEVTHPFHYDFFLNSHHALQGTARPVHYHVLMDEIKQNVNTLQRMIYHQCYTFCRSTTPISLHPAVYYAHLAGARARCHENLDYGNNARVPEKVREQVNNPNNLVAKHQDPTTYSSDWKRNNPPPRLAPLVRGQNIHKTMWWV